MPIDDDAGAAALPPGAAEFLARLNAWRAVPLEEQLRRLSGPGLGPSPDGRIRVGVLCPCLHMGGAEAWGLALMRTTDPAKVAWVGCCVIRGEDSIDPGMRAKTEELAPVTSGLMAARQLAESCDVLIVWAVDGVGNLLANMATPPRVVAVCHSPVESPWGVGYNARATGIDRWVAVSELALPAIPEAARATIPTSVIWNAVDTGRMDIHRPRDAMRKKWGVPHGAKVAGYLGRLSAEKDPHALARMIGHLPDGSDGGPPWHAVLVGGGAEVVAPHERLHLAGNDPAAGDVLGGFDVLVVPSSYESFCLTMAEGFWAGIPVISTEVGLARMVPGLTRIVPLDADGPTLARAVLDDSADIGGRTTDRVARAQAFARERLNPEAFGRAWTDLIVSVAPTHGTPKPSPHLADCGDDIWVGDQEACDKEQVGFPNIIHVWREDRTGWGVCRHVLGGRRDDPGHLTVAWKEEELTGAMRPTFDEVIAYARRPGRLLVHCAAGVTRSTGIALAAKIARGCPAGKAEADIRAAMKRDRNKDVLWNLDAVKEIVDGRIKSAQPPRSWSIPNPSEAQVNARLSVLRNECPHAAKLPGCGCNGEVGCGLGKGSGADPGRASIADCRACLRGRHEVGQRDVEVAEVAGLAV